MKEQRDVYKYPDKLVNFLTEQEAEGSEIYTTHSVDGVVWIIDDPALEDWFVLVEWYDGQEDFAIINLYGKSLSMIKRLIRDE